MRRLGAVVLAAGEARRFGRPKQLLRWRGATLVERAVATCLQAGCEQVVVVTGAHGASVREVFAEAVAPDARGGVRLVDCAVWAQGMSASLACGIRALVARDVSLDAVFVVLPDQPLVDAGLLRRLSAAQVGVDAAALTYPSGPGVPACFGEGMVGRLTAVGREGGAKGVLRAPDVSCRLIDEPARRRDVDTIEAWEEFRRADAAGEFDVLRRPGRIEWVTGPVRSGKTTALAGRIAAEPEAYCGLLAPVDAEGVRWLCDVVSGERRRLTCRSDAPDAVAVGRFHFHGEVFGWGRAVLVGHYEAYPERVLVIDELGKLELRGEGLAPDCWQVLGAAGRVVGVVRAGLVGVILGCAD